ncbi:uncharacterized protein BT62DRAFT_1009368 [Guyanagaster necrorhizus]|uniref:Uncharacterized protein n=1 Tax=Guyanagaster necrorhizus TaxID=856835 RepID=A0A9P7VL83_9AGAR|nr:uncharacterized protein BT62DRAFT_1009368 [Guyanagaster necrorhizus MCA 3950]KAG7443191.1 hypothetical protein BT62DRAFT_1009368 [Guyanagaster necrorhizus MCA 3950]
MELYGLPTRRGNALPRLVNTRSGFYLIADVCSVRPSVVKFPYSLFPGQSLDQFRHWHVAFHRSLINEHVADALACCLFDVVVDTVQYMMLVVMPRILSVHLTRHLDLIHQFLSPTPVDPPFGTEQHISMAPIAVATSCKVHCVKAPDTAHWNNTHIDAAIPPPHDPVPKLVSHAIAAPQLVLDNVIPPQLKLLVTLMAHAADPQAHDFSSLPDMHPRASLSIVASSPR